MTPTKKNAPGSELADRGAQIETHESRLRIKPFVSNINKYPLVFVRPTRGNPSISILVEPCPQCFRIHKHGTPGPEPELRVSGCIGETLKGTTSGEPLIENEGAPNVVYWIALEKPKGRKPEGVTP